MTVELLQKIEAIVNRTVQKELVTWTGMLTGFHLVLRKSNLVPFSRVHDMAHNICRKDIRFADGVMVVNIRWSKTNQNRARVQQSFMFADNNDPICPIRWLMYMINTIPAKPYHNLLSFTNQYGELLPITYRDLTVQMRAWLDKVGVKDSRLYLSHSLRWGATTKAFKSGIPEETIMTMGDWSSQCYKNYIEVDLESKVNAWFKFTKM